MKRPLQSLIDAERNLMKSLWKSIDGKLYAKL